MLISTEREHQVQLPFEQVTGEDTMLLLMTSSKVPSLLPSSEITFTSSFLQINQLQ